MRTISLTATPLPTAYDCVAVDIAGRRTNLVVYGCRPKPTTKKGMAMGLLPDTQNWGLRMCREYREHFSRRLWNC